MLTLYLDDAGDADNKNETVFAVGGCVATTRQWERFEEQWGAALRETRIPKETGFHATDFFARKIEPFKSWPDKKHRQIAKRFAGIAETHFAMGVGRGVDASAYNRIVRPEKILVRGFDTFGVQAKGLAALVFCARTCMEVVGHWWPNRPKNEEIAVVIAQGVGVGAAIEYFRFLKENSPQYPRLQSWTRGFSSFTMAPSSSLLPLQAADLVAYESRLELVGRRNHKQAPRPTFERLTKRNHLTVRIASEGGLQRYVDEMKRLWDAMQMAKRLGD